MTIACAQHPDGGPGALEGGMLGYIDQNSLSLETFYLEVTAIDLGREGGPDLQVASHLDVRGLGRGPDLI